MNKSNAGTGRESNGLVCLDLLGHITLGLFILSVPVFYLNENLDLKWVSQFLSLLMIATNSHCLRFRQWHPSMVCLCGICGYFACTAFSGSETYISGYFMVYLKFVAVAIWLSLIEWKTSRLIIFVAALALSSIIVASYSSSDIGDSRLLIENNIATDKLNTVRTSGMMANANAMGTYSIYAALAGLVLSFYSGRALLISIVIPCVLSSCYLALYSGSRKAIIGLVILIVYAIWRIGMKNENFRSNPILASITTLTILAGGMAWLLMNPFASRFSTDEGSYIARDALILSGLAIWRENPIFGLGYHGYEQVDVDRLYTHSTPVELLSNGGIVACGLYVAFWWYLYRSVRTCLNVETDLKERSVLLGIGVYILILFINSLFTVYIEDPIYLVLAAFLCGTLRHREIELLSKRMRQSQRNSQRRISIHARTI